MTARTRLVLTGTIAFIAGVSLAWPLATWMFARMSQVYYRGSFAESAALAQLQLHQLQALRAGDTDKVIHELDQLLDINLSNLASYDRAIPAAQRDISVYDTLAQAAAYRSQHPSPSPRMAPQLQAAFALARRHQAIRSP